MKAKQLNALLGKLAKDNPDQEVTISYPGFLAEPEWDEPALVQTKQQIFIVPKAAEESIEENHTPAQVAEMIQKSYNERNQQSSQGQQSA